MTTRFRNSIDKLNGMSFNLFNSDGSIDQGKFATAMRNLEFLSNLGMSASVSTNQHGGDKPKPTGMSSSGITAATHGHATTPKGINSTQNSSRMACVHPRPNNSTTPRDSAV